MRKAYKYRIYPNDEQKTQLAKMFGCCRFVYNKTLAYRKEIFEKKHKTLTVRDCIAYYHREIKPANAWLSEVDEPALINAIYHMDLAYRQSFKKNHDYPKFKRKHDSHKSYTTNAITETTIVDFANNTVTFPMLSAIKAKLHRTFDGQIKSATISQSWSGKYYVSFVTESEHQDLPHTQNSVGLNLRTKNVCVTSDGKTYLYAAPAARLTKRLSILEKQLKRKQKGSTNYFKQKKEIALCYERIIHSRRDTLHKISHEIVSENQVIISEIFRANNPANDPSALLMELQKLLEHKAKLNHRVYVKTDMHAAGDQSLPHRSSSDHSQDVARRILLTGLHQLA